MGLYRRALVNLLLAAIADRKNLVYAQGSLDLIEQLKRENLEDDEKNEQLNIIENMGKQMKSMLLEEADLEKADLEDADLKDADIAGDAARGSNVENFNERNLVIEGLQSLQLGEIQGSREDDGDDEGGKDDFDGEDGASDEDNKETVLYESKPGDRAPQKLAEPFKIEGIYTT